MTSSRSRLMVLRSYFEVVKRILRRKVNLPYGREAFFDQFWADAARAVGATKEAVGDDIYRIRKGNRSTLVQFHYVHIDTYFNLMLVSQKPFVCRLLAEHEYPIARYLEYDIRSVGKAREFLTEISGNFVVKPRSGAGGGGVTTGINSHGRLNRASAVAAAHFSHMLMIEEQFAGDSFRLLYLDGEFIDAIKRSRPTVIGDGKKSIRELIDEDNRQRRDGGPSDSLFELQADLDCEYFLQDHGLKLSHVPAPNEVVTIKNVVNENSDRDNFSVRDDVHPELRAMGQHISSLLGTRLIGIDVMTPDISVPLKESGGVINEINIPPGLHYHEMIANKAQRADVGARILEYILTKPGIPMCLPEHA